MGIGYCDVAAEREAARPAAKRAQWHHRLPTSSECPRASFSFDPALHKPFDSFFEYPNSEAPIDPSEVSIQFHLRANGPSFHPTG